MDLRDILKKYKEISMELIEAIKEDANIDELLDARQELLKEIVKNNLSQQEKKAIGKEFDILKMEELVKEALEKEQSKVKDEIRELHLKKQANKGYGKNINSINFFSTKV